MTFGFRTQAKLRDLTRWALVAIATLISSSASAEGWLYLEEVRNSVRVHHPLVAQAFERQKRAEALRFAANGYFDPSIKGQVKATTGSYYELRSLDVELRQQTGIWGVEVYGGYRNGQALDGGLYPTYYSDQTLPGGEFRVGAELPFFRDGPIDSGRARIGSAEALLLAAQLGFERQRLELELAASKSYFRWVAAGHKLAIGEEILAIAEERGGQLNERTALGAASEFERLDNERMILERRERLALALREFEQTSLELGLYVRTGNGERTIPGRPLVPEGWSDAFVRTFVQAELERKLSSCHPQAQQLRAELKSLEIELRLAQNQVFPDITLGGQVSRDIGNANVNPALAGTVLEAQLKLTMPLLLRADRGQRDARSATVREKQAELRFLSDRLKMLVDDLDSRERVARTRREQTAAQGDLARKLATGERDRFESGASNLLFVNLRELAVADAETRHVDAEAQLHEVTFEIRLFEGLSCRSNEG